MVEPCKVSRCPLLEWYCSSLVECGDVVWCMQCSWCKNMGACFNISITAYSPYHIVSHARFCSAKRELVEHSIEGHEIRDGNDVGGLYVGGDTYEACEVTFSKRWIPIER